MAVISSLGERMFGVWYKLYHLCHLRSSILNTDGKDEGLAV